MSNWLQSLFGRNERARSLPARNEFLGVHDSTPGELNILNRESMTRSASWSESSGLEVRHRGRKTWDTKRTRCCNCDNVFLKQLGTSTDCGMWFCSPDCKATSQYITDMNRAAEKAIEACNVTNSTKNDEVPKHFEPITASPTTTKPTSLKAELFRPVNEELNSCYITNTCIY